MHADGRIRLLVLSFALLAAVAPDGSAGAEEAAPERLRDVDRATLSMTYAPGVFEPAYTPPQPGTYELPVIARVTDHPVVGSDGRPTTVFALTGDRLAVVAFIYTSCVDAVGCPISHAVLHRLDRMLANDPVLAKHVTMVTLSFDPDRDTPARMAEQRKLHDPHSDWRFATTHGGAELQALLADFDQQVAKLRYEDGTWSGLFRHVLKVFLLDGRHQVRAIYSTGFLDQALVLNDLKTLAGEPRS
jgi:cytochrome oxidase Cu insertion factor (SCO1/SenC/PrrC family)